MTTFEESRVEQCLVLVMKMQRIGVSAEQGRIVQWAA